MGESIVSFLTRWPQFEDIGLSRKLSLLCMVCALITLMSVKISLPSVWAGIKHMTELKLRKQRAEVSEQNDKRQTWTANLDFENLPTFALVDTFISEYIKNLTIFRQFNISVPDNRNEWRI